MNEKLIQISLFVEGVTENHTPGALVGELFANILCDGFKRLQKGDRFWFENNQLGPSKLQNLIESSLFYLLIYQFHAPETFLVCLE